MSYDISGYIEVNNYSRWRIVVDLGPILLNASEESNLLFGLAKFPVDDPNFGDRGIPENCSPEVLREYKESIKFYEENEEAPACYTYALWSEIKPLINVNNIKGEWKLVFDLASSISQLFGPDKVRLILRGSW